MLVQQSANSCALDCTNSDNGYYSDFVFTCSGGGLNKVIGRIVLDLGSTGETWNGCLAPARGGDTGVMVS